MALAGIVDQYVTACGRIYPGWTRTELLALTPRRLFTLVVKATKAQATKPMAKNATGSR